LYYDKGIDWYSNFFDTETNYKAYGELSHDYFLEAKTAMRIYDFNPNVKLIACLRNPADKIISNFNYAKRTYLSDEVDFQSFFQFHEKYKKNNSHNMNKETANYYENLYSFYELFPIENILVVFYDDLKSNPQKFIQSIYQFLDVDATFVPSKLNEMVNPNTASRSAFVAHFAYAVASIFRKIGLANFVGTVKRNNFFNSILYRNTKSVEKKILTQKEKEMVDAYYKSAYPKLEKLIEKAIPKAWND